MGGSNSSSAPRMAGFRVVHLWKGSPAHLAGLELFFDSILEVDGLSFVSPLCLHPSEFSKAISAAENRTIKLVVVNSRTRSFRDVWVTPRKWSDQQPTLGLLGASVRFVKNVFDEEPTGLRVLRVFPDSPACQAGLMALDDYLMGAGDVEFKTLDDLLDVMSLIRAEDDPALSLYVYNAKQENVRSVLVHLRYDWGGDGSLGADVGQGLIHRIPRPRTIHPNSYAGYTIPAGPDEQQEGTTTTDQPPSTTTAAATTRPEQPPVQQQQQTTVNGKNEPQQQQQPDKPSLYYTGRDQLKPHEDRTPFLVSQESSHSKNSESPNSEGNAIIDKRTSAAPNTNVMQGSYLPTVVQERAIYPQQQHQSSSAYNESIPPHCYPPPINSHYGAQPRGSIDNNHDASMVSMPPNGKPNSPQPGMLYQTR